MRHHAQSAAPLILCALLWGGCASSSRVTELEGRISRVEREREALVADLRREQGRLQRLHAEIEQSTEFLRHNGARVTSRLDALQTNLKQARGDLEVIAHSMAGVGTASGRHGEAIERLRSRLDRLIADLRDRAGIAILALPRDLPERAEDWVTLAQRRFDEGEVRVAEAITRECSKRFGASEPAARCGLLRAKIAFEEHRFADAIETLQGVHDAMGGKPIEVVGEALLAISAVLEAEGKCAEATGVLDYLRKDMPKLPQARQAKQRHGEVRQRCKKGVRRLPEKTSGSIKPQPVSPDGAAPAPANLAPKAPGKASAAEPLTPKTAPATAPAPAASPGPAAPGASGGPSVGPEPTAQAAGAADPAPAAAAGAPGDDKSGDGKSAGAPGQASAGKKSEPAAKGGEEPVPPEGGGPKKVAPAPSDAGQ